MDGSLNRNTKHALNFNLPTVSCPFRDSLNVKKGWEIHMSKVSVSVDYSRQLKRQKIRSNFADPHQT